MGDMPAGHTFIRPEGFDPLVYPWTLESESVEEAYSAFLFQRIPARNRSAWMDELWRVLMPGAKAIILVPYWSNARAIQDPMAEWPPLGEQSFLYFNRKFREDNKIRVGKSNFDFVYGYTLDPETITRPDDTRPFWIKHYTNSILDLQVVLEKKP